MAYRFTLDRDEQRELLGIARATVREFAANGTLLAVAESTNPHLTCGGGAFVTLNLDGRLRGCIGTQAEDRPLYRTVQEMAVAAASRDPRFSPVSAEEVEQLTIEVSVLGDRGPVSGVDDIEIGVHGLTISCRGRRGLLLPQVAEERHWTADEFLGNLCGKAGLPNDAWRDPEAVVERFTAQVFSESSIN
jgi:AmmeMemoRadiSam system protein A